MGGGSGRQFMGGWRKAKAGPSTALRFAQDDNSWVVAEDDNSWGVAEDDNSWVVGGRQKRVLRLRCASLRMTIYELWLRMTISWVVGSGMTLVGVDAIKEETHAARWGLMRGFACYCNEVGGLRCDRLNPKGVSPPHKVMSKIDRSQGRMRVRPTNCLASALDRLLPVESLVSRSAGNFRLESKCQ